MEEVHGGPKRVQVGSVGGCSWGSTRFPRGSTGVHKGSTRLNRAPKESRWDPQGAVAGGPQGVHRGSTSHSGRRQSFDKRRQHTETREGTFDLETENAIPEKLPPFDAIFGGKLARNATRPTVDLDSR